MRFLRRTEIWALTLGAATLAVAPATAEEFHMKDETKIVGTIVAYEKDSFRVETSFGVAIIYKDRIARIVFPEPPAEEKLPVREADQKKGIAAVESAPTAAEEPKKEARSAKPPTPRPPEQIVERVTGTRYVNETYRFQMFKPPTWRSFPQLVKPQNALVAALGTPDETTLMLIGRESYGGDLAGYARLAENSLRQLYADYRPRGEQPTTVAGLPAVKRDFTGEAEGRFWTGMALYFAHGRQYYTVLGLTAAGDTTPFQQAVLRKVVDTLTFLPE